MVVESEKNSLQIKIETWLAAVMACDEAERAVKHLEANAPKALPKNYLVEDWAEYENYLDAQLTYQQRHGAAQMQWEDATQRKQNAAAELIRCLPTGIWFRAGATIAVGIAHTNWGGSRVYPVVASIEDIRAGTASLDQSYHGD